MRSPSNEIVMKSSANNVMKAIWQNTDNRNGNIKQTIQIWKSIWLNDINKCNIISKKPIRKLSIEIENEEKINISYLKAENERREIQWREIMKEKYWRETYTEIYQPCNIWKKESMKESQRKKAIENKWKKAINVKTQYNQKLIWKKRKSESLEEKYRK